MCSPHYYVIQYVALVKIVTIFAQLAISVEHSSSQLFKEVKNLFDANKF